MESGRKLSKMMARFFPPGLILEFKDNYDNIDSRTIDLLSLNKNTDISYLIKEIIFHSKNFCQIFAYLRILNIYYLISSCFLKTYNKRNNFI